MPEYLLLLHDDQPELLADVTPEEIQAIIAKYQAWTEGLSSSGHLVGSNKLKDGEGRVMHSKSGKLRVIDGPYSEAKEVVGGYYLLRAADYDEVVALCQDCPHLEFGAIEVRQIEELG